MQIKHLCFDLIFIYLEYHIMKEKKNTLDPRMQIKHLCFDFKVVTQSIYHIRYIQCWILGPIELSILSAAVVEVTMIIKQIFPYKKYRKII